MAWFIVLLITIASAELLKGGHMFAQILYLKANSTINVENKNQYLSNGMPVR